MLQFICKRDGMDGFDQIQPCFIGYLDIIHSYDIYDKSWVVFVNWFRYFDPKTMPNHENNVFSMYILVDFFEEVKNSRESAQIHGKVFNIFFFCETVFVMGNILLMQLIHLMV